MSDYSIQPSSWPALQVGLSTTSGRAALLLIDFLVERSIKSHRVYSSAEIQQRLSNFLETFLQPDIPLMSGNKFKKLIHGSIARSARPCPAKLGFRRERSSRRDPAKQGPALDAGLSVYFVIYYPARARQIIEQKSRQPRWHFLCLFSDRNSQIINGVANLGKCMGSAWEDHGKFFVPSQSSGNEALELIAQPEHPVSATLSMASQSQHQPKHDYQFLTYISR